MQKVNRLSISFHLISSSDNIKIRGNNFILLPPSANPLYFRIPTQVSRGVSPYILDLEKSFIYEREFDVYSPLK